MIRGAKIYWLLFLFDLWRVLVNPTRILSILTALLLLPFLLPAMMCSTRELQNNAIFHGLNAMKASAKNKTHPPILWQWLFKLLDPSELPRTHT